MSRPKIGLTLGSGGARGFAHIGVIKALEKENIPIDIITGSSMGSLVGTLYGAGQSIQHMERFAKIFKRKYYLDFTVPKMGFITGNKVKELIYMLSKGKNLEDLTPIVAVVATDLLKGERVVFKEGPVAQAVRASISIPGIFVPEKVNGRLLVDGGVIDRVPVTIAKDLGADITIAVDVSYFETEPQINSVYDVILQSMDIMEREIGKLREIDADVMIRPMVKQTNSLEFSNVEEYISLGEAETYKQMDKIKHVMKDWKEKENDK